MYEFSGTGQLLPILVGTQMDDPGGTGQMVPILGAERDPETDSLKPLGGTMEDPDGDGMLQKKNTIFTLSIINSYCILLWEIFEVLNRVIGL